MGAGASKGWPAGWAEQQGNAAQRQALSLPAPSGAPGPLTTRRRSRAYLAKCPASTAAWPQAMSNASLASHHRSYAVRMRNASSRESAKLPRAAARPTGARLSRPAASAWSVRRSSSSSRRQATRQAQAPRAPHRPGMSWSIGRSLRAPRGVCGRMVGGGRPQGRWQAARALVPAWAAGRAATHLCEYTATATVTKTFASIGVRMLYNTNELRARRCKQGLGSIAGAAAPRHACFRPPALQQVACAELTEALDSRTARCKSATRCDMQPSRCVTKTVGG